jgi:hypothetical protein
MDLLLYLPADAKKPVPLILNIGFSPNSSSVADSGVHPGEAWSKEKVPVELFGLSARTQTYGAETLKRAHSQGIPV